MGASWEGLGGFLGDLEASWGRLGRSWGLLEWSVGGMLPQLIFFMIFGSILDRSWGPKGSPNRFKIEGKNKHEKCSLLEPSWTRLGPVLGRFGVDLGVKNHKISLVFKRFRENIVFFLNK